MSTTTTQNPIEIRKAGMRALTTAMGYDNAQAFLKQYSGSGDIVKELREQPEPSHDELMADIYKLQDARIRGQGDRGQGTGNGKIKNGFDVDFDVL